MKLDTHNLPSSRASILRRLFLAVLFCCGAYIVFLPLSYILQAMFAHRTTRAVVLEPGEDRECGILQRDVYTTPWPSQPKSSPFCGKRAQLLEALSSGGRHGFDEPFVGKGCTYKWFSTPEICMILERFSAVVFVGDDVAQSVYTAFNILLREDLILGGVRDWMMGDVDQAKCKCDGQFLDIDCLKFAVKSIEEVKNAGRDRKGSPYLCERIPHAYVAVETVPAPPAAQNSFKDLTFGKPNPWQPSPLIFSFGQGSSLDSALSTKAVDEWYTLASASERNVPMLFLSPPAFGLKKAPGTSPHEGNLAVWNYHTSMAPAAKEKHFDVLSMFNLTLQASSVDGERFGTKVALVEAMMVINWLSKLETS
ncbi:hypothetical protein QTJ16_005122 [Diplocarpon rosae]|uniref:Uncharacterized protein n=1 Tax=Diplocarpon rosae TaxID=946125 RepID=A0AAD9SY64_9HELO|nr:hypothetical protein QTJ16_005122 [Diplocarpon rosae]